MADPRLIPSSISDARMQALCAILDRLDALPVNVLTQLYDPYLCHEVALPYLAHQFGVLDAAWNLTSTNAARRSLIRQSLLLQKRRGTPWALRQALSATGWPGMTVVERSSTWAHFKVVQPLAGRSVTQTELDRLLPTIDAWKPARCILESIQFNVTFTSSAPGTGPRYDGTYRYDGTIKYEGAPLANISYVKIGAGSPTVRINAPTVVDHGASILVTFLVDTATANGLAVDTLAIYSAADTLIASATMPVVTKTSAVSLSVAWTINKI